MKLFNKHVQIFLIVIIATTSINSQTWSTGADIPEAFRASNFATYKNADGDGFLYVISGRNSIGAITPRNQRYDLTNNIWTDRAPLPTGVLSAATARIKDSIYVIGGFVSNPSSPTRKVYKYSINQDTWSQVANHPVNISDTEAVAYQDSLIYVVGGFNSGKTRVYNSVKNTWRNATPILPSGNIRWGALTVANDKLIYMCGGDNNMSSIYSNTVRIGTVDQNNRANITWSLGTPFPGSTRAFFEASPWKNGIIMTGGSTNYTENTTSNECYFYNLDTGTWTQLPSKPTPWLFGNAGSILIGNEWKFICASGYANNYLNQTEIFTENVVLAINDENKVDNFKILISPIPVLNILDIQTREIIKEVSVYNLLGKKVTVNQVSTNSIDVSNLAQGIYIIKVISENDKTFSSKFIKE